MDPKTFEERIKCFNIILKFLIKRNFVTNHLVSFLQTNENLPVYGKIEVNKLIFKFFIRKKDISNSDQISFLKKNKSSPSDGKSLNFMKSLEKENKSINSKTEEKTNKNKNKSLMQNQNCCSYGTRVKEISKDDSVKKYFFFV